ncbi:LacI family DNA-binding transcriptional regulator [Sphaerisporangium sp. NPDC051011]|uniref:LacI family DNA-binding transcriptional regulator n=1 Tax=Sphaerisporangium sp. NPDC051011 TaxID=3155792 RepID=UPI0033CC8BFA
MPSPETGPSKPTLATVAEKAGVSRATASRVFSQPHRLSADTVRRVRAVAAELGYQQPNPDADTQPINRSHNLALVVADTSNPFFPPMIQAAERQADLAGYSVFLCNADEDPRQEDQLLTRFTQKVDGFVIASSRMTEVVIQAHAKRHPVVLINRDLTGLPRVLIDTTSGVAEAVNHLAELGHREITYLSGPTRSWSNGQRRDTVKRTGELRGMSVAITAGRRSSYEAGKQAVEALLASGSTAVIAFDDMLAQGLLAGLAERGVSVPDEFSVIGCDDVPSPLTHPQLTTVSARSAEAGTTAVDLLTNQLAGRLPKGDHRHLLTTTLIPGATTAEPAVNRRRRVRPQAHR